MSPAGPTLPAVSMDAMSVAVARKALNVQRQQGQAAVQLIQTAAAVPPPASTDKGKLLSVFA